MNRNWFSVRTLLCVLGVMTSFVSAEIRGIGPRGEWASLNLQGSRIKAEVGAQWVDIEEEAELQITSEWATSQKGWSAEGTFRLPPQAVLTGCLVWNKDTLLMGKLRTRADAQRMYDSIVPPRPPAVPIDPLLISQENDSVYNLKLYPFTLNEIRKIRIRYIVPVLTENGQVEVTPVMAKAVNGDLPTTFSLQLRGTTNSVQLVRPDGTWRVSLPGDRIIQLARWENYFLKWNGSSVGNNRALRSKVDSGSWKGDFVLYTSKIPDSILQRTNVKSETVVLWRWINPGAFFVQGWSGERYVGGYGYTLLNQVGQLKMLSSELGNRGDKMGMVADQGLGDSLLIFGVGDSGSSEFRRMQAWLGGINEEYLLWRIPNRAQGSGDLSNLQISRNRQSFRTDLTTAGTLYSKSTGVLRHLLIVTVGPVPSGGEFLEVPDASVLPADVTVSIPDLNGYVYGYWYNGYDRFENSQWPGVNLAELANMRRPVGRMDTVNGIPVPFSRKKMAVSLSMDSDHGTITQDLLVQKGQRGEWVTQFNAHGPNLGNVVQWAMWDENGDTLGVWKDQPQWINIANDSIVPRLWARSAHPISKSFGNKELAPIFGFVDTRYSLLALPTDTVGKARQTSLRDSGMPFLAAADIFARQAYGDEASGLRPRLQRVGALQMSWLADAKQLQIELGGLGVQTLELRDLQGRLLQRWTAQELKGKSVLLWKPAMRLQGVIVASARTINGILSARFVLP